MRRQLNALALAALLPLGSNALANRREPKRDRLTVGARPRLEMEYCAQGDVGRALQRRFDKNRTRVLEPEELELLEGYLAREALALVKLTADGRPFPMAQHLRGGSVFQDQVCANLELEAESPLAAGDHRVVLADRHADRSLTFSVELQLAPGAAWRSHLQPVESLGGARRALTVDFAVLK
jgi:hypothetical protein